MRSVTQGVTPDPEPVRADKDTVLNQPPRAYFAHMFSPEKIGPLETLISAGPPATYLNHRFLFGGP